MPNNITNRLVINASDELKAKILYEIRGVDKDGNEMLIDFNKIIPMPEELNINSGSATDEGYALAKAERGMELTGLENDLVKQSEQNGEDYVSKRLEVGRIALSNKEKYGHTTWYSWRYAKWGTKWNAYDQRQDEDGTLWFSTAWCTPMEIYTALSAKYPEAIFEIAYADEDVSYNCGKIDLQDSELIYSEVPEGGTKEAYEIAFELEVAYPEEYELKDGTYHYKEDDE